MDAAEVWEIILAFVEILAWPVVVLVLACMFMDEVKRLLCRLKSFDGPGGLHVEVHKEIEKASDLSHKVRQAQEQEITTTSPSPHTPLIPLTEANARMLELGLRPSPSGLELSYYNHLCEQDPALALAGLRIELELMGQNLAAGFEVPVPSPSPAGRIYKVLADHGAVSQKQFALVKSVLSVANAAVHGTPFSEAEAKSVIDSSAVLRDQYLAWLSWGFSSGNPAE